MLDPFEGPGPIYSAPFYAAGFGSCGDCEAYIELNEECVMRDDEIFHVACVLPGSD